jgi:hypothetical protein
MNDRTSRRSFVRVAALGGPAAALFMRSEPLRAERIAPVFPTQPPELVQEMVVVAHFNVARVKELVGRQPTLAKATWDWGYGDWETALGAASHVGNAEIAETLLASGAHPTLFSAAMLGQLDVVKAYVAAAPGIERTRGPHSISLLKHAVAGGPRARAVADYLKTLGDADDHLATEPLTAEQIAKLTGPYVFGVTPADRLDVTATNSQLQVARPGHYPRPLFHRGSLEFSPVGAENVRLVFADSTDAMVLTIHDPDVVLTARRAHTP